MSLLEESARGTGLPKGIKTIIKGYLSSKRPFEGELTRMTFLLKIQTSSMKYYIRDNRIIYNNFIKLWDIAPR